MLEVDFAPWAIHFALAVMYISLFQVIAGLWIALIIRSSLPSHRQLHVCLAGCFLLAVLSSRVVDVNTLPTCSAVSALTMVFTIPLHAISSVERSRIKKVDTKQLLLRSVFPAALPSSRHPSQSPWTQLAIGSIYLTIAIYTAPYISSALRLKGIERDFCALAFLTCVAAGILNLSSAILAFFGFRSPAPFRNPLLSTSMTSFWSGRWNAPVSDALRKGVYEPLLRRKISKPICSILCFVVSGLAHEAIFLYLGKTDSRGEWFMFFFLAGLMAGLEQLLKHVTAPWLRHISGMLVLYTLFHFLFVPPPLRNGLAELAIEEFRRAVEAPSRFWSRRLTYDHAS